MSIKTLLHSNHTAVDTTHSSKTAIQIGTMTEKGSALNLSHEFLATANSDEGDGQVFISSMRSTDEGQDTTVAVTNESCFSFAQHTTNTSTVSSTGSTFALVDASGFAEGNGLYYYGSGTAIKVARCTRNGNNITVVDDLTDKKIGGQWKIMVQSCLTTNIHSLKIIALNYHMFMDKGILTKLSRMLAQNLLQWTL